MFAASHREPFGKMVPHELAKKAPSHGEGFDFGEAEEVVFLYLSGTHSLHDAQPSQ